MSLKTAIGMALNSGFPKAVICGPDLITIYNDAFIPILGQKHNCLGRPFNDIWAEAWDEIAPMQQLAYAGQSTFIEDFPLIVDRNGHPVQAYFTFSYSPIRDGTGQVIGMMDTVIETTSRVVAERDIKLINAELQHRIKNTFAMVLGIARQTFQAADSVSGAEEALTRRLLALSAAHASLGHLSGTQAVIGRVIEDALAPYAVEAGRIKLEGPPIALSARQCLSLALVTNELASNALKYGALSAGEGCISVRWTAGRPGTDDAFQIVWDETGGPDVQPSGRVGFGTRLIRALGREFGGSSDLKMRPEGIVFEVATTMKHIDITDQGE
ncbi:sensor histidine kinase [Ancylobacter pratisalsi]|nr:PAS domain-containing sensor histidine kinase [Ancylobacter pratisalsi]